MDLDLRLARHFVVLAEMGHFSRAAVSLHLSQSALTKQVQALERQAGMVLIDRSRRPWLLTAAGTEVLALSRDLCARADRAARATAQSGQPDLTIGFQSSGSGGWPIGMILLACREALQRPVRCRVLDITAYLTALLEEEIDVLVTRPAPRHPGLVSVGVLAEPRTLLMPRRWPEADAAALTIAEAAVLPLVYNPAMSPGDNGVWALGDVRPLREARLVVNHGGHFVEILPDLISGAGSMAIAPPMDKLLPAAHARSVALPEAPLVETAVCWRADRRGDAERLAATIADALASWALRQRRTGATWAPAVCREPGAALAVTGG